MVVFMIQISLAELMLFTVKSPEVAFIPSKPLVICSCRACRRLLAEWKCMEVSDGENLANSWKGSDISELTDG